MSLKREIHVAYGRYECWLSKKWGYVINPDYIEEWSSEAIREYAAFCILLAQEKEKWDQEHAERQVARRCL